MTSSLVPVTDPQLPALSPDLILVRRGGAGWAVETLSERLAEWCGLAASAAVGRSLQVLFPDMIPSLTELADEVVGDDRDIGSAKVQLRPDSPALLADLQFSGLTDDYRGHRVQIFFRQPSIASQHERGFRSLIGQSAAMREVFRKIRLYAGSDAAVIITGETGAGKELVAKALHEESARARAPYAALNCTAISEQLLESELFGHERGAFTGAVRDHRGYFEQADGGTLFLDEIGDMPLHTQGKLLRVLEDGNVQRVGSERAVQVDVRVIGATNVPLEQAVAERRFRSDLYHRLAVLRIHLPPLRERADDIPLLADFFLQQFRTKYNKSAHRLTADAIRLLQSYLWPGNVRELRNVLERVVVENEADAIGARAFSEWIRERQQFARVESGPGGMPQSPPILLDSPVSMQRGEEATRVVGQRFDLSAEEIVHACRQSHGNLSAAARLLGVHRATLYRHLKRLNLDRSALR